MKAVGIINNWYTYHDHGLVPICSMLLEHLPTFTPEKWPSIQLCWDSYSSPMVRIWDICGKSAMGHGFQLLFN